MDAESNFISVGEDDQMILDFLEARERAWQAHDEMMLKRWFEEHEKEI